jgi:OmcA/MtrC family decaheme c-type cytochrome
MLRTTLVALSLGVINCGGSDGAKGDTGDKGETGDTGKTGKTGPAGTDGTDGTNGTNGNNGVDGATGAKGETGAPGATGATGATGASGAAGLTSLINTTSEPKGTNCPVGGVKIEIGTDVNKNSVLDANEVDSKATKYVCNVPPPGSISTGLNIKVVSVSPAGTSPITVRFTLKDDQGFPIDLAGGYSLNTAIQPRFVLAYYVQAKVSANDPNSALADSALKVYTKSGKTTALSPTAFNPASSAANGIVVENGYGAGDFTYTFPTTTTATASASGVTGVAYEPGKEAATHVVWIQASRQTDRVNTTAPKSFYVANQDYYFTPDGTSAVLPRRAIASQAACNSCHREFKAETDTTAAFHSGSRVAVAFCNVCHNPDRKNSDGTPNIWANSAAFVHRIHFGNEIAPANRFHEIAATYPQDIRNCTKCHNNNDNQTPRAEQFQTNPTIAACGSCHDGVDFVAASGTKCISQLNTPRGINTSCVHTGGPRADGSCATCHDAGQIAGYHVPVVSPDPNNCWALNNATGCNNNTHASYVAAADYMPAGAIKISYDVKSVKAVDVSGTLRPQITFKLKKQVGTAAATDVVFQTYSAGVTTELMPSFVGSPSVYFAWSVPQDKIAAPADFNASANGYIKNIWNGTATSTGAGTMTGPDTEGYYTITLTGVQISSSAKMLTGGVGYSYSLSSAPPLVQTDLSEFPYNTDGKKQGGLSVPAEDVWKVADGYAGRRAIVENDKCTSCHGTLGVSPNFHAGQRNDGPTCSFCHTPNRTSNGWSAGSKYFIHAIHATRMRSTPFNWHMDASIPNNQWEAEFPSPLNDCEACHAAKTYDFSLAPANVTSNLDSISSQLLTTVGADSVTSGTRYTYTTQTSRTYFFSPYVDSTAGTSYGLGYSYNAGTNTITEAETNSLVISPITTACASCHDSQSALAHMQLNGGRFYETRANAMASFGESCLTCHGPGKSASIANVHD